MKLKAAWNRLLKFLRLKSKYPKVEMLECIALDFWLGEWADPKAIQAVSEACLKFSPMYWVILPPNHIDIIFANTLENIAKVQRLVEMVEDGSLVAEYATEIKLGIQSGTMMVVSDKSGFCIQMPIGMTMGEAAQKARKATEQNRCVGWPIESSMPFVKATQTPADTAADTNP